MLNLTLVFEVTFANTHHTTETEYRDPLADTMSISVIASFSISRHDSHIHFPVSYCDSHIHFSVGHRDSHSFYY